MNIPSKRFLSTCGKLVLSVALLWYLFWISDLSRFVDIVESIHPIYIPLAWIYYGICTWLSAYRWKILLEAKDVHAPVSKLFSFYMVGMFFNNFLPGAVGGDIVKVRDLYRYTRRFQLAVTSVFLERFTGLIGLTFLGIGGAVIGLSKIESVLILACLVGAAILLALVVAIIWFPLGANLVSRVLSILPARKILETIKALYQLLHSYRKHKGALWWSIAVSVLVQLLFAVYYALAAITLGIDADVLYFVLFLPVITIVTMVPISLGGLGVREAIMVMLFAEVGVSSADVLAISLSVYVVNTALSLWGGLILLVRRPVRREEAEG